MKISPGVCFLLSPKQFKNEERVKRVDGENEHKECHTRAHEEGISIQRIIKLVDWQNEVLIKCQ